MTKSIVHVDRLWADEIRSLQWRIRGGDGTFDDLPLAERVNAFWILNGDTNLGFESSESLLLHEQSLAAHRYLGCGEHWNSKCL